MSEEGDKTCPLCAEEMDLTDQQLKPCKCGYDICVWCWHHIMDMAEKDQTQGRCPACRSPYNKEKIVTAASSGRLASELYVERRSKSQKGRSKTEGRKHLARVRVIQKNLVYVVGLPLNFADEDLLQRWEYFGQYGKVLKVSISRNSAGSIQQYPNSTCSIYITYSKDDEALRCIMSVHGFVLDGRPLRACFGTTKYCHAWLRNVPCNNPDCLYVHEIGSQEDSFTKDEVVSAYTRVQQFTGSLNTLHHRSGNMLPPPADDYNNGSASLGKSMNKTSVNTNQNPPAISSRISPPNSNSKRSSALPAGASWGSRSFSGQTMQASRSQTSNGPLTQKPDVLKIPETSSTTVVSQGQKSSLQRDDGVNKLTPNAVISISQNNIKGSMAEKELKSDGWGDEDSVASEDHVEALGGQSNADRSLHFNRSVLVEDSWDVKDQCVNDVSSHFSAMSIHQDQCVDNGYVEVIQEPITDRASLEAENFVTACSLDVQPDHSSTQVGFRETEDGSLSFESRRLNDHEAHEFNSSRHSSFSSSLFNDVDNSNSIDLHRKHSPGNQENIPNANSTEVNDDGYFRLFPSKEKQSPIGSHGHGATFNGASNGGEDSIVSNSLSPEFDMWNGSLISTNDLVKFLGEGDVQQGHFRPPSAQRVPGSSQSRFPFAREHEANDYFNNAPKQHPIGYVFPRKNDSHPYNFEHHNDLSLFSGSESDLFASIPPCHSSSNISVPTSPMPAPPGFSTSTRAPPPGFASHGRTEQPLENFSGNRMLDTSSLPRNQYHTPAANVFISDGIEFMDPAILAVGKGMLPNGLNNSASLDIGRSLSPQFSMSEEARFQSMWQRSLPPQQNQRYNSRDSFSLFGDATYGIPSRAMEQTLANSLLSLSQSHHPQTRNGIKTSNGQWNSWSEIHSGKDVGMTESLGIDKFFGGREDSQIRMHGSGNLFNGTYGI